MVRPDALALQDDGAPRCGPYDCIAGGKRNPPATDLELHHESDLEV
jgi:hypothetical protein